MDLGFLLKSEEYFVVIDLIIENGKLNTEKIDFSKLKNKRILLTGCTGLIGINLLSAIQLVKDTYNIEVFCLVNKIPEYPFKHFFEGCFVVQGDLTNSDSINYLLNIFSENQYGVDYIIHAAGYAQPKKFTGNKLNTILVNTKTTLELFKLLNPGGTFLFVSTSELYSGINEENIKEDRMGSTNTDHSRSCYIDSKKCGETILYSFKEKGYNIKIARVSLCYGPGTKKDDCRVISEFVKKGILENKIDLLDTGESIRTYCYVSDTTEMLWNILFNGKDIVYNIGGISKVSILEIAKKIANELHCEVSIPEKNDKSLGGNPQIVNVSIEKYLKEFGNKNFIDINFGISKNVNWIKYFYEKKY